MVSNLQFMEGWDVYPPSGDLFSNNSFEWIPGGGNRGGTAFDIEFESNIVRTGIRSIRITGVRTNEVVQRPISAPVSVLYVGFGWYDPNNGFSNSFGLNTGIGFGIGMGLSTIRFGRGAAPGNYALIRGNGNNSSVVADVGSFPSSIFHYTLLRINTTNRTITCWVNRELVAENVQYSDIGGPFDQLILNAMDVAVGSEVIYDDIFVWSDPTPEEVAELEFRRDFRVRYITPNALVSNNGFTTSGVTTEVSAVSNIPLNLNQSIEAVSVGSRIEFEFEDIIDDIGSVLGLQTQLFGSKSDAGLGTLVVDTVLSGVSAPSADFFLATDPFYFGSTEAASPDGTPWIQRNPADLNNIRGVIRRTE